FRFAFGARSAVEMWKATDVGFLRRVSDAGPLQWIWLPEGGVNPVKADTQRGRSLALTRLPPLDGIAPRSEHTVAYAHVAINTSDSTADTRSWGNPRLSGARTSV